MQSGLPFDLKISSLSKDSQLLQYVRQIAMEILDEDPLLSNPMNAILLFQLEKSTKEKITFSQIS
jgi:ATP-dependent DNA helicase RecG